jgi:predicted protein tyrosine phosphatase
MEFIILDRENVARFVPKNLTYAIRILDLNDKRPPLPLINSSLYLDQKIYRFDDAIARDDSVGLVDVNTRIAILKDFLKVLNSCPDLKKTLVHCNEGRGRSPSVAGALRHVFFEDYSHYDVSVYYPDFNEQVYHELVNTAKELKIGRLS